MRILVLVKITDGEINPFDASALECALQQSGEVTVLSMCPPSAEKALLPLTRLGVSRVILLTDSSYAGSDTLATARILTAAVQRLAPDVVFCGRQSIDGDTAQVGPEVAALCGWPVVAGVLRAQLQPTAAQYQTRNVQGELPLPAVLTFEKSYPLRFPSIRSRMGTVERLSNADLQIPSSQCGLRGSPTRVLQTFENAQGRRHCKWITYEELPKILQETCRISVTAKNEMKKAQNPMKTIAAIGNSVLPQAKALAENVVLINENIPEKLIAAISAADPDAVLWNADAWGRTTAPQVAALLGLGLCADCTKLETDGQTLWMYRPARGGNIMAKIMCKTRPQMATVRTASAGECGWMIAAGRGIAADVPELRTITQRYGGVFCASRGLVDSNGAPYEEQVGLTGRTVSPSLYVAIGISGAVHHTCAIENAGVILAVNPDRSARIFDYTDYGIAEPYDAQAFNKALNAAFDLHDIQN